MNIKLKSLSLTNFKISDKKKFNFVREINYDHEIAEFVTEDIVKLFIPSEQEEKLTVGPAYIIEDKEECVGFIYFPKYDKEERTVVLNYGVHPDHRNKRYGTKILEEVSEFVLNNTSVKNVELYINGYNKGSIKCAEGAKFKLEETIPLAFGNDILTYRKHK